MRRWSLRSLGTCGALWQHPRAPRFSWAAREARSSFRPSAHIGLVEMQQLQVVHLALRRLGEDDEVVWHVGLRATGGSQGELSAAGDQMERRIFALWGFVCLEVACCETLAATASRVRCIA